MNRSQNELILLHRDIVLYLKVVFQVLQLTEQLEGLYILLIINRLL